MDIVLNVNKKDLIETISSKFGNSSHIIISKSQIGKKVKIITGDSKLIGNRLHIPIFNSEILERTISSFGTGAHVILPKEYSDKKIKLILEGENSQLDN